MRDTLRNGFRNRYLFALDLVLLPLATYLAFVVRFEGLFDWREPYRAVAPVFLAVTLPVKLALLISFGLYRRLWRFASVSELESILLATGTSAVLCSVIGLWVLPWLGLIPLRVPLGVLAVDALMTAVAVSLPRFILRTVMWHLEGRPGHGGARVLIAGAGQARGQLADAGLFNASPGQRYAPDGALIGVGDVEGLVARGAHHDLTARREAGLRELAVRTRTDGGCEQGGIEQTGERLEFH